MTAPTRASAGRWPVAKVLGPLAGGLAALAALSASAARAQESISLTLQSDYLFRGVSLSDGRPTLGVDFGYDNPSGLYIAASATAVDTRHAGVELLSAAADVGYAKRLKNGVSLDVGLSDTQISTFVDSRYVANYAEVYVGIARGGLAARLYFSPEYLGESSRTLYLDVSETVRPADKWRLTAHAGLLNVISGNTYSLGGRSHLDLSAGVARDFGRFEARLTASWADPPPVYPEGYSHRRAALVAGASVYF